MAGWLPAQLWAGGIEFEASLSTYCSVIWVEGDVVVKEDVLLFDGFGGELHRLAPRPAAAGEAHVGETNSKELTRMMRLTGLRT